jgi:hypothetical protein
MSLILNGHGPPSMTAQQAFARKHLGRTAGHLAPASAAAGH